jgi:hypothetical protein
MAKHSIRMLWSLLAVALIIVLILAAGAGSWHPHHTFSSGRGCEICTVVKLPALHLPSSPAIHSLVRISWHLTSVWVVRVFEPFLASSASRAPPASDFSS